MQDFPDIPPTATIEDLVMKLIPNLMTTTIVEFSKGTKHASDSYLNGFFLLHRLMLWALETYPTLQKMVDSKLKVSSYYVLIYVLIMSSFMS